MKYCPYCGVELINDSVSFCAECGKELPAKKAKEQQEILPQKLHTQAKNKKSAKRQPAPLSDAELRSEYDEGYDGYYEDLPPVDDGKVHIGADKELLKKIVSYGWASAMQQATVQMGKIAVQGIVNTMGVNTMAAFAAASRIDDFAYTPQQNIAHAMTTLMAQNRGAGKKDRVKEGFRCGIRIELVYAAGLTVVCFFGAEGIMRMFAEEPEVIELGARFLRLISLMYFLPALTNGIQGFFRGIGDLKITLRSSMLSMAARVPSAALLVLYFHMEIEALPWSYAFGWFLMLAYEVPPMLRFLRSGTMERNE